MSSLQDKLLTYGASSLSDSELVALILELSSSTKGEDSIQIAESLLEIYGGSLSLLAQESIARLRMCEGLGIRRAVALAASSELGKRTAIAIGQQCQIIRNNKDVVDIFRPLLSGLKREEFWVLYLTSANKIIEQQCISQGGVSSTTVDPKLLFKRAIELLASQFIILHNHPSGSAEPSQMDIDLTKRIREAATLLDLTLMDHIIIAPSEEFSFLSNGLL